MDSYCLLIPVYNHEAGIRNTVRKLEPFGLHCIIVDDGSTPACAAAIDEIADAHHWIEVFRHEINAGKGAALKTGFAAARHLGFTHALQIDADEQHEVSGINTLLEASRQVPDAVILGSPTFDDSVPKIRFFSRYLTHFWVWVNTLSFDIKDAMCGFRVYPVPLLADICASTPMGDRMEFDVEVLVKLHWQGAQFINVPVQTVYPEDGTSHFRLLKDNWLITKMHTRCFFLMLLRQFRSRGAA